MPHTDAKQAAKYKRSWYERNKVRADASVRAFKESIDVWINGLKVGPCADCGGEFPPYVLDFHHRAGEKKLFAISNGKKKYGKRRLEEEMAKCDLICANCHRIRHHKEEESE